MKNDFFISYASEDTEIVTKIVESLEKKGLKCWYAPRDVMGRYAKAIVEAIDNSSIFLICLSKHSAVSEHVLNEVEMVYNKKRSSNTSIIIEPLCLEDVDMDAPEYDEIMYYIRRINFISPPNFASPDSIAEEIYNKNRKSLQLGMSLKSRTGVGYEKNEIEEERLRLQNEILREYDSFVYDELLSGKEYIDILDVGCGTVNVLSDRLKKYNGIYRIVGVERDGEIIEEAKQMHKGKNIVFLQADVEESDFIDDLLDMMDEHNIEGFDLIHISMFLMYLKDLSKLFRKLKRLLKDDGVMLIKDIDDGINYAYPDDEEIFEKSYRICAKNPTAGYRQNGRQILHYLLKSGMGSIDIKKQGLTTIGMTQEKRDALFNMYYQPIAFGLEERVKDEPSNQEAQEDLKWINENYEKIHEKILNPEFVFSLGIVIYTAKKSARLTNS